MLVESENGGCVRGMLVSVHADEYDQIVARLDLLEGYDPDRPDEAPYRRLRRKVQTAGMGSVVAWVYLGQADHVASRPVVHSGDWATYAGRKSRIVA